MISRLNKWDVFLVSVYLFFFIENAMEGDWLWFVVWGLLIPGRFLIASWRKPKHD
jgi:hypothetical protein